MNNLVRFVSVIPALCLLCMSIAPAEAQEFRPRHVDQLFRNDGQGALQVLKRGAARRKSAFFSLGPPGVDEASESSTSSFAFFEDSAFSEDSTQVDARASQTQNFAVIPTAHQTSADESGDESWPAIWINGSAVAPKAPSVPIIEPAEMVVAPAPPAAVVPEPIATPASADPLETVPDETPVPDEPADEVKTAELVPQLVDLDAPLDAAMVREWKATVETLSLPDDVLATTLRHYEQAAKYLSLTESSTGRTENYRTRLNGLANQVADFKQKLSARAEPLAVDTFVNSPPEILEEQLRENAASLEEAAKAVSRAETAAAKRKERKPQMAAIIAAAEAELAKVRASVASPPAGRHVEAMKSRRIEQIALIRLMETQLSEHRAENDWYGAASELFSLEKTVAEKSYQNLEHQQQTLNEALAESRRRESQRQAAEAREMLQNTHPALRAIAERNAELTRTRIEFQDHMKLISDDLATVSDALKSVEKDFGGARDKESRAGLTTAVGMQLRNHRKHLHAYSRFHRKRAFAEEQISRLQLQQMLLEDERDAIGDVAAHADDLSADLESARNPSGINLPEMAESLLNDQNTYLNDLLSDYEDCLENLTELDVTSKKLTDTVVEFRSYIDERVLWIRSADPVSSDTLSQTVAAGQNLMSIDKWAAVVECLLFEIGHYPYATTLAILAFVVLLSLRSRLVRIMHRISETKASGQSPAVLATVAAIGLTLLTAMVWPCVFWLIGWRLTSSMVASDFAVSFGYALRAFAAVFCSIEVFRQICRPGGVAEKHLGWPTSATGGVHANLVGLLIFGLPIVFVFGLTNRYSEGILADSLGRMAFIIGMPLLAFTLHRMVNPNGVILKDILHRNRDGWMFRLRHVWHVAAVGAPLLLGVMVFAGYQYTASQLLIRLVMTFWLAILMLVAFSLATRALAEAQREFARVQHSGMLRFGKRGQERPHSTDDEEAVDPEQAAERIAVMRQQVDKLVRAVASVVFLFGCWTVWSQVLPAFQILDRIELWQVTAEVAEEFEVNGQTESRIVSKPMPITPARLIVAAACLAFAVVAGRNIPALLELSVLRRLPIDNGGRHAITTLCRYGITFAGVVMACKAVGIGWSSVQWLVAALTVGLGFGLQEIFANFVSGLIILFERPIRIGDVVTVDGVTGTVARIQIRATTILDLDRKEYIVPNKEFVTGRVLNWTLSDNSLRVIVNVGVAYGSDVDRCRALMLEVANQHPLVLPDPPAVASFEGFGASSLDLTLRCFIPDLHHRVDVVSDLHAGINRAFEKGGIAIPFPQMDLHVRPTETVAQIHAAEQPRRAA